MVIGIPGWAIGPNSFGVTLSYLEFVRESLNCDDMRILLPDSPIWTDLDLLILPGGADINPSRYDAIPSFYTDKPDILKEYFDVHVLPRYIANDTPIFGICRGCQSIAVHFGGKLHQNMYHETNKPEDPYSAVHALFILSDPSKKVKVNSRHHQAIRFPQIEGINVLAVHKDYRHHVEAIRIQDHPIIGVQWHPEDLSEDSGIDYTLSLLKSILKNN